MHRHEDVYLRLSADHRVPPGSRAGPRRAVHGASRPSRRQTGLGRLWRPVGLVLARLAGRPGRSAARGSCTPAPPTIEVPGFSGDMTVVDRRSGSVERRLEP